MDKSKLLEILRSEKPARSAYKCGVQAYAVDVVDEIDKDDIKLNDISYKYDIAKRDSYGGCYLIYDEDIARRLCCPSELKRVKYGEKDPNSRETWLDVQARALYQARLHVRKLIAMNDMGGEHAK